MIRLKGLEACHKEVLTDTGRVTLVLENLLRFAIKMASKVSVINLECQTKFPKRFEGTLLFALSFSSSKALSLDIENLFEQNHQDMTMIGLYISKKVIEKLNGVISVTQDEALELTRFELSVECLNAQRVLNKQIPSVSQERLNSVQQAISEESKDGRPDDPENNRVLVITHDFVSKMSIQITLFKVGIRDAQLENTTNVSYAI